MTEPLKLGVCYYPEHWPEDRWPDDGRRMREMGLSRVRIGEFAWSRIEPEPGLFDWGWYDRAVETLADAGLQLIICTPTATPPKWLVDAHPDILASDDQGRPRRFGSRRHYCFSSTTYARESARITQAVVDRYGNHPAVVAWQTDNEYGCHDTVESFSTGAAEVFRDWLAARYSKIGALNAAWGTVFWSQEYGSFAEVDPPNLTVTEANPAHRFDWRQFSSEEVAAFNRAQVDIIRAGSPGRDVTHNFMGFFSAFDHHKVGRDLDAAAWDSYPLGFLDQGWDAPETKHRFLRQGHPDFAAFHHDLYRGCTNSGRMWVMEQQPGPVNWAPHNPAPLPGMVRLWSWEAWAHGAELVSYFRWRQAPFGQEQMHAGLLRPDHVDAPAAGEVRTVAGEVEKMPVAATVRAPVALILSYQALWMLQIQPQGQGFDPLRLVFEWYSALRGLGLDVDIISPLHELSGYRLIVAPSLPVIEPELVERLVASGATVLLGPRSASKTREFQIPAGLPMSVFGDALPIRVTRVESLPPGAGEAVDGSSIVRLLEEVEGEAQVRLTTNRGAGLWFGHDRLNYLAGWADRPLLADVIGKLAREAGLACATLPDGLRLRRRGPLCFAFNYGDAPVRLSDYIALPDAMLLGIDVLEPSGVAAWHE